METVFVAATVAIFFTADRVLVVPMGLGSVAFGALVCAGWMTQVRLRARGSSGISWDADLGALTVDDQRLLTTVYLAGNGALALFMVLATVVLIPPALDGGAGALVTLAACVAVLAVLLWGCVVLWRRGTARLVISPDGLRRTAGGKQAELAWRDVHGINPHNVTGKDYSITVVGPGSARDITIIGQSLAADPALVAQLLEFYRIHEDARPELATETSLRRVQTGGFGG